MPQHPSTRSRCVIWHSPMLTVALPLAKYSVSQPTPMHLASFARSTVAVSTGLPCWPVFVYVRWRDVSHPDADPAARSMQKLFAHMVDHLKEVQEAGGGDED